jgi:hypothetical protein
VSTRNKTLKLTVLPQAEAKGSTCFARPPLEAFLSIIDIRLFVEPFFSEKELIKAKIAINAESQAV